MLKNILNTIFGVICLYRLRPYSKQNIQQIKPNYYLDGSIGAGCITRVPIHIY